MDEIQIISSCFLLPALAGWVACHLWLMPQLRKLRQYEKKKQTNKK